MKRYLRRWVALAVFVVVLGTTFVMLGRWQLDRLEQRRERNEIVVAHESSPVVPFADAFRGAVAEGDQWQRVEVRGTYDAAHQLLVRYRHLGGRNGFEVVTPLVAGDRTVLVDRGFVENSPGTAPQAGPPPSGEVAVVGYVRRNELGPERAIRPVDGEMRLVNAPAVAGATGLDLVDGYLQLATSDPTQDAALIPLGTPELDEGPHLSYALQWFTFTAIAVLGMFVFIRGDVRERRRSRSDRAATSTVDTSGVSEDDPAPGS